MKRDDFLLAVNKEIGLVPVSKDVEIVDACFKVAAREYDAEWHRMNDEIDWQERAIAELVAALRRVVMEAPDAENTAAAWVLIKKYEEEQQA